MDQLGKCEGQMMEMEMLDGALKQLDLARRQMNCPKCGGAGCKDCLGEGEGDEDGKIAGMGMGRGRGDGPGPRRRPTAPSTIPKCGRRSAKAPAW